MYENIFMMFEIMVAGLFINYFSNYIGGKVVNIMLSVMAFVAWVYFRNVNSGSAYNGPTFIALQLFDTGVDIVFDYTKGIYLKDRMALFSNYAETYRRLAMRESGELTADALAVVFFIVFAYNAMKVLWDVILKAYYNFVILKLKVQKYSAEKGLNLQPKKLAVRIYDFFSALDHRVVVVVGLFISVGMMSVLYASFGPAYVKSAGWFDAILKMLTMLIMGA